MTSSGRARPRQRKRTSTRSPDRDRREADRESGPPRRGRPPKLSRELVLEHALRLLEAEPDRELTMGRIVDDLDAVPSALYRHFRSREDLMNGLVGLVLRDLELEIPRDGEWTDQVRGWMRSVYEHLSRYPTVIPMLRTGNRTSAAWLSAGAVLLRILEAAGFHGRKLAVAALFVKQSTVGFALQGAPYSLSEHLQAAYRALPDVAPSERVLLAQYLEDAYALGPSDVFDFAVDRTVASLADFQRLGEADPSRRSRS